MKVLRFLVGLILACLVAGLALAQDTIGDLLAGGGKRLTKDEVLAALRGTTVTGPTATGGETLTEWKEDGSVSGYVTGPTGNRGSLFGAWRVDDDGKFCLDMEVRFKETRRINDCFPVYRLGDQLYFPATPSSDPSTAVLKRTTKR